jgi:ribose 1,5-bisphosphate isomerase
MSRLEELRNLIANNEIRGGSAFGRSVAEVIALTMEVGAFSTRAAVREAVIEAADWGVVTKPSMTSVRAVADLARATLDTHADASPAGLAAAIARTMRDFIESSKVAITSLAEAGEALFEPGSVVATHSFSESLVHVLRRGARSSPNVTILLTESRPLRESRHLAQALADTPATLQLFSDAGMAIAVQRASFALVGADAIFVDGSFANKTGSLPLALVCRRFNVPYYVVAELSKVHLGPASEVRMEVRPDIELAEGWALAEQGRVGVWNQFFETVPGELVSGFVTDRGLLSPSEAVAQARQLAVRN